HCANGIRLSRRQVLYPRFAMDPLTLFQERLEQSHHQLKQQLYHEVNLAVDRAHDLLQLDLAALLTALRQPATLSISPENSSSATANPEPQVPPIDPVDDDAIKSEDAFDDRCSVDSGMTIFSNSDIAAER